MRKVIIPLNAFNPGRVMEKGQGYFVPFIHRVGAFGVELRRELMSKNDFPLSHLKEIIQEHKLYTVYSAPVELWKEDGLLNIEKLNEILIEVSELEANALKIPLGNFREGISDVREINSILKQLPIEVKLLVENDQTSHGGTIHTLLRFFESVLKYEVNIRMTFDIGNWLFTGESVDEATHKLMEFVEYVHLKHVEEKENELVTMPLILDNQANWQSILDSFPSHLPIALEFPLESEKTAMTYVNYFCKEEKQEAKTWSA